MHLSVNPEKAAIGKALLLGLCATAGARAAGLPIVDLGYEIHQAISYDTGLETYNFTNIRYAAPPVGSLRFAAPSYPEVNRTQVQTGAEARICPQAVPSWMEDSMSSAISYVTNGSVTSLGFVLLDTRASEDCLFLDVVVPKKIFNDTGKKHAKKAPVLVWIYGGGYTSGSKSGQNSGSPNGLLQRGDSNFIYVTLNYRLGALGFLSGPTLQRSGVANAGLLDQRFALEWIQKNIHLFGGDPDQVTVMGESAGGGSILHQITAYGNSNGNAPFQQAILQSPAFAPGNFGAGDQEKIFNEFLAYCNVSNIEEARRLPTEILIQANAQQVINSPIGSFTYWPVVDGVFVPEAPATMMKKGKLDKGVSVMLAYNGNDGVIFSDFSLTNDTEYRNYVSALMNLTPNQTDYLATSIYPPVSESSIGYVDEISRAAVTFQEGFIQCNDIFLAEAMGNRSFNYVYDVFPSLHAMDLQATFDVSASPQSNEFDSPIALQQLITSFVLTGKPTSSHGNMSTYGTNAMLSVINATAIYNEQESQDAVARCDRLYDLIHG
ncbi:hypothetical protein LT330_002737 [Penicillium expansum]|nr:hypothetical protein LT330_002737 [Penicillium expansum]